MGAEPLHQIIKNSSDLFGTRNHVRDSKLNSKANKKRFNEWR